jgi:bifunctional non-homologous end joining protein LigD
MAIGTAAAAGVAGVRITHPARVLFPGTGITKLALATYFEAIAPRMVPHVAGRPLTLVRCPTGIADGCFYMKHSKVWAPKALERVEIQEKTKVGTYLVANSAAALVSLAQMNVLEIHTWNSRVERLEEPDRLVFDIDPGPEVGWPAVAEAARHIRTTLQALDLESFPKTTGGRGLHVVVPLVPSASWQECLAFARGVAARIEAGDPGTYTTEFAKAGREHKLLIDYLRNNRTNTSVAAWSPRARPGAPVSIPLAWREVGPRLDPARFTLATVASRLSRQRTDPWAAYWSCRQRLTAARLKAVRADG